MAFALETERLRLRELGVMDAGFLVELLNEPGFLRFIGDKGVRDEAGALTYIASGPAAMIARYGFGLWRVGLKSDDSPIGICGLLKRDSLPDVDLGFALLPRYGGQGYAQEAAACCRDHGFAALDLRRLVAIATTDNARSARLLEKLGFRFERLIALEAGEPALKLFGLDAYRTYAKSFQPGA